MSVIGSNVLAGASGGAGAAGYEIERSLRFNSDDSAYLDRTPSSTGNRKTWTWSGWVKFADINKDKQALFSGSDSSTSNYSEFRFLGNNSTVTRAFKLNFQQGSTSPTDVYTGRLLRDPSAWYHTVIAVDFTQSTAADRVKIYVNNELTEQVSSSGGSPTIAAQNTDTYVNLSGAENRIGDTTFYSENLDGYLADVHFIDGQALAPTDFGEYDDNNVWQPKEYTGTYGTNGFHLDFSDNSSASALGTDSSGNSNDWTVNNLTALDNVSTSAITNVGSTTGTVYYSDNNNNAYDPANLTVFSSGQHSTTASNMRHVKIADLGTGSIALTHVSGNNFYITGSNTTTNTNSSPLVHGTYGNFTIDSSFGYAYARIYAGGGGQITYNATVTGPPVPVLTTTNNNNYSSLAVGDSNAAGVSITAINSSTPSITVDGGSWSNGDVFTVFNDSDSVLDTPTNYEADSGNNGGNYCTWNPLNTASNLTLVNGNLDTTGFSGSSNAFGYGTIGVSSGKWYYEATPTTVSGSEAYYIIGWGRGNKLTSNGSDEYMWYSPALLRGASTSSYGASWTAGDVIGVALDLDAGTLVYYKNGVSQGTAFTGITGTVFPKFGYWHGAGNFNFGQRAFAYTAPSGYKALCTANLPDPTIADGSTVMDVITATGTAADRTFTMSGGFGPDFVWAKLRNGTSNHALFDTVRGATKRLVSNSTQAEDTQATQLKAFTSTGFTYGSDIPNNSSQTGVYWCWDGGTSTVSNTDGSITSTVRANASAGFSIVQYTLPSSGNFTVGHGLNAEIGMIIMKDKGRSSNWNVWHSAFTSEDDYINLNSTGAKGTATDFWGASAPGNSTFGGKIGTSGLAGNTEIAYCWSPVEGFSAFGSYEGNGSTDGPFVYTGFRPRWLLLKRTDDTRSWQVIDTARSAHNVTDDRLFPDDPLAESSSSNFNLDILSNGFKCRTAHVATNLSGGTYIYAAFGDPFKTARAR